MVWIKWVHQPINTYILTYVHQRLVKMYSEDCETYFTFSIIKNLLWYYHDYYLLSSSNNDAYPKHVVTFQTFVFFVLTVIKVDIKFTLGCFELKNISRFIIRSVDWSWFRSLGLSEICFGKGRSGARIHREEGKFVDEPRSGQACTESHERTSNFGQNFQLISFCPPTRVGLVRIELPALLLIYGKKYVGRKMFDALL